MKTLPGPAPAICKAATALTQTLMLVGILLYAGSAAAADFYKADNSDALNLPASWTNNAVPGPIDIATWDDTISTGATNALGTNMAWGELQVLNPGGPVDIAADGNTLTLSNQVAVDMSQATKGLELDNNVLIADPQIWSVGNNQTLFINGLLTRNAGGEMLFHFDTTAAQAVVTAMGTTGSLATGDGAMLALGSMLAGTSNDVDFAALSGTGQIVGGASLGIYTANPATGGTPNLVAGPTTVYDFNSPNDTDGYNGCRISTTTYVDGMRFNTPQTNTAYLFDNVPAWLVTFKSGNVLDVNSILVTTNDGNSPVVFGPGGDLRMYEDNSANALNEMVVIQNNPAANLVFQSPLYERTAGNGGVVTKIGPGTLEIQALAGNSGNGWTGSTRIYGGTILIDGPGTIGTAPAYIYNGGNFEGGTGSTNNAPIIVNNGGSDSVYVLAANGQFKNNTNLTFGQGAAALVFNYTNLVSPSSTVAPLLVTNGTLSISNSLNVSINCGSLAVGQFPLIKYNPSTPFSIGTNAFTNVFNLANIEPHVTAFLSNNTANNSIDLVVTSVNEPIHWAAGSGVWDIGITANWQDSQGNPTTYQQSGVVGDNVLFNDSAAGPSPIAITLNSAVYPSSITNSSSADNYSISGTGSLNGVGTLTKSGSSTFSLAVNNTMTGGSILDGGILSFSALNNLSTGPLVFNGGTLQYAAGNTADISSLVTTFQAGGATIDTGGNNVVYSRPLASGSGGAFTKTGAGSLTLSGTNTFTGPVTVELGVLDLSSNTALPDTSSITVDNGAVFSADGLLGGTATNFLLGASTAQTLAGTGTVDGEIVDSASGVISPAGSGTDGTMAFGNDLAVSGGTLVMDVSSSSHDLITVVSNLVLTSGTLQLNVTGTLTPGTTYPLITYGGSLISGAGSSANLTITGFSQQGAVATLSETAGQINLVIQTANNFVEYWTGSASSSWDIGVSDNWLIGATPSVFENGDLANFNDSASNPNVNLMAAVQPGSVTIGATNTTFTFSDGTGSGGGKISGPAALSKTGPATLYVNTVNNNYGGTYNGPGSAIQVGNGSSSGDLGSGNIANQGTLLYDQPDSRSVPGVISGTGSLTQEGAGTLALTNNNTYTGGTTISSGVLQVGVGGPKGSIGAGPVTNNASLVFALGGSLTMTNGISGSGSVTMTNTGILTLGGANSYTGTTYVEGGDLKIGSSGAIPLGVVELDGQNGPAGLFDLNGYNLTLTGLAGTAGATNGIVANNSGTTVKTLTINTAAGSSYSGQIVDSTNQSGAGKIAVVINGGGNQTFDVETTAGNTYSGGTIISNASLTLSSANSGNLGANAVGVGTGTVALYNGTLNLAGSGAQDNGLTWTPPLTNTVSIPAGWTGTVAGAQRGEAFAPAALVGNGTFIFLTEYVRGSVGGNWSAFGGEIYLEGTDNGSGNLGLATTNSFGKVYCTNYIVLYNTLANTPTISFGELSDDGTTTIESTSSGNAGGAAAIFSVGGANTSTNFGGTIIDNVGIAKVGTGVWGLTNGYGSLVPTGFTYTGPTIVSNGILAFSNLAPTASTPITIAAPGVMDVTGAGGLSVGTTVAQTLQGNGTLTGSLVVGSLGVLQPGGANPGPLTVSGSTELQNDALVLRLNTTNGVYTNDTLVTGSLLIDSGATLLVTNLGPALYTGDSFQLFKAGSISGAFASVTLPSGTGSISYVWNTNNLLTTGVISLLQGATPVQINTNSSNLVYSVSASQLTISWPSNQIGWTLESQTNPPTVGITTNWSVVAGSTATNMETFTISSTNTAFYRLVYTNTP